MRFWCLPPSKSVVKKVLTHSSATSFSMNLAGSDKTLALLCCLASAANSGCQQSAALIFWCLFAVMLIPFPVPHIAIP